jgi:hypothetical protein
MTAFKTTPNNNGCRMGGARILIERIDRVHLGEANRIDNACGIYTFDSIESQKVSSTGEWR